MKLHLSLIMLITVLVSACVTSPLKAPCDEQAHFCGSKTKINHW